MKQFVLTSRPDSAGVIRLYEKDYHYLVRVRRLKAGKTFNAILPGGTETTIRIISATDNVLIGVCSSFASTEELSSETPEKPVIKTTLPPITLFQGMPKGTKMDTITRQATEGAVSLIVPFESEYSSFNLLKMGKDKFKRWERITKEARQQSGSDVETKINTPCSFEAMLELWEALKKEYLKPLGLLLHHQPLDKSTFHDYLGGYPDAVALAVGPEGGFSDREVELFLSAGFKPIFMGNTILRTETAAIYGVAAINILLSEIKSWRPIQQE